MNRKDRRVIVAEKRGGAQLGPEALDASVARLAPTIKAGLPLGWDVTLVLTRHPGDGRAQTKISSTLPPEVSDAVLMGLGDALREQYAERQYTTADDEGIEI